MPSPGQTTGPMAMPMITAPNVKPSREPCDRVQPGVVGGAEFSFRAGAVGMAPSLCNASAAIAPIASERPAAIGANAAPSCVPSMTVTEPLECEAAERRVRLGWIGRVSALKKVQFGLCPMRLARI